MSERTVDMRCNPASVGAEQVPPRSEPSHAPPAASATIRAARRVAIWAAAVLAVHGGLAQAAVSRQANWASQYAGSSHPSGTVNASYSVASGTNRLLVVAISSTRASAGAVTCSTVSYGGQALTLASGDGASTSTWNHTFLYYLRDTPSVMDGAGHALNVTCSGGTGYYTWVYAAVYAGVDQTTPFTDARSFNSTSTSSSDVGPFSPALAIAPGDQAIEIVNLARSTSGTTYRSMNTWATGWTTAGVAPTAIQTSGPTARMYIRDRAVPSVTTNDGSQHTADSTNTWDSMTAMSLHSSPTVTIGNGSGDANTTATAGQANRLDVFTLATDTGTAELATVRVGVTQNAAALSSLFIDSASTCDGTTYGTLSSGLVVGDNDVPVSGITVTASAATYYVCGTAATVSSSAAVIGNVAFVGPAGAVIDQDASATTFTVTPPVVTIGNGSPEAGDSAIYPTQVGPIDAFSVRTAAGTATLTSVTVQLTAGSTALTSLFINSSSACTGTTYGTRSSGIVIGSNAVALSTPITATTGSGTTNLYVCGRAASVAADATVTGNVSSVAPGIVTDEDGSSATLTVRPAIPGTTTGTLTAHVDACNQITVSATYTGDTDGDNTVAFTRSTDGTSFSTFGTCASVAGGTNPRTCVDGTAAPSTTYWYRALFSDSPDGVAGTNPITSAGVSTGTCPPNLILGNPGGQPGAAALTVGASWRYVGQFTLASSLDTVTLGSIGVANAGGTPAASAGDLQLNLTNAAGSVVYSTARWDGARWVFEAIADPATGAPIAVGTSPITFRVYATAQYGAAAGETFAMRIDAANVVGLAPAAATTGASVSGNGFTTGAPAIDEGSPTDSASPVVSILNPEKGKVVSGDFLVQVYVYSANGTAIAAKGLSTNGTAPTCASDDATLARTSHTYANARAATYAKVVTGLSAGTYTLKACARNGTGTAIVSAPVTITVRAAGTGDGNLLVRDNSSQLCADCHDQNMIKTHSSETLLNQTTGLSESGSWAATCRDCHTPHGTRNLYLVKEQIVPPAVNGYQTAKSVYFATRVGDSNVSGQASPASSSLANSDNTGPCQVCHTRTSGTGNRWRNTGNQDTDHYAATSSEGTAACTGCHAHSRGFAALESKGNESCRSCHGRTANAMAGSAPAATPVVAPRPSRHSLVGYTDTYTDAGGNWAATTNLADVAPAQRSCVNMCHQDHVHNAPGQTEHAPNVSTDASSVTARAVTRNTAQTDPLQPDFRVIVGFPAGAGGNSRTDFDAAAAKRGLCVSCHEKPIDATKPAIGGAAYAAGAHNSTSTSDGTNTYAWRYRLHDGSTFDRNCTKCHASRTEGTTPSPNGAETSGVITAVHGTDDPNLLAGSSNPAGTPAGFICYNCHGSAAAPGLGAQGNRSAKNVQAQVVKAVRHNVNADAIHDSRTEFSGTYPVGTMHVSCMDCHDSHAASAANPLANAPGVNPTNGAAGAAPASYTFVRIANPDVQYQTCFRCHSSFTPILPAGTTNAAIPFNPANDSLHYVEADKGAVPVNTTGTGKGIWQNATFNHTAVPGQGTRTYVQVMMPRTGFTYTDANLRSLALRCSDCHGDDAADGGNAVPEGPHGSARTRLLKTPAGSPYTTWNASVGYPGNTGTIWCFNCHNPTFAGTGFDGSDTSLDLHRDKHDGKAACQDCHLANPHGQTGSGAAGQRKHLLKTSVFSEVIDGYRSTNYPEDHGSGASNNCN